MTSLALRLPSPPRFSWPRVGAISGTVSLHVWAMLLLLTPPVAYQVLNPAEPEKLVVTLIEQPPKPVEIVDPVPPPIKHIEHKPVPVHHETVAPVAPPVITDTPSVMSYPATPTGPATDIGASVEDVAPTALGYGNRTQVKYPREALQRREHGTVILRVLVGADGLPQDIEIEKSSGSRALDNAARDAVNRWTFRPGTKNGVAQSAWARVPIAFDLQQL